MYILVIVGLIILMIWAVSDIYKEVSKKLKKPYTDVKVKEKEDK